MQAEPARTFYGIDARFDPHTHALHGTLDLRFVNSAAVPVSELYFHLYLNAFESRETVFIREGGEQWRRQQLGARGSCKLSELRTHDGRDLLAHARHELLPGDRTQLHVMLPEPVAPGATLRVHARFVSVLPKIIARSGFAGGYHLLGQFFPKLAKLEPDGHFESSPYHGLGEFYADFADFELTLRTPSTQTLACNGSLVTSNEQGASRTQTYRATRVLDVACVSGPGLQVFTFEEEGEPRIEVIAPMLDVFAAGRQAELARFALRYVGTLLGPYPHEVLRIAIAPEDADAAAGMEYPGLVTTWGRPLTPPTFVTSDEDDSAITHEIAHQWFPMLVATNETQHPWLDEGLSQWLGMHIQRKWYAQRWGLSRWLWPDPDLFAPLRSLAQHTERARSSLRPAYEYELSSLIEAAYVRPALVLEAVGKRWGEKRVLAALSHYARTQRFAHPTPHALFASFDHAFWPGFSQRWLLPALETGQSELLH